ncbi:hypothetical protein [Burkholderia lata]|uniref:hypothetical protein n=1 Tax=Burkholderia lata (strain ATCC 17760 / DSM 23089 / LMG 22485 / NCIMB 9086 / R18194 / 383) TaxID=482957 RepID=UPI00399C1E57
MINIFIVLISVFVSASVWAKNACVDFLGEQSYPPLSMGNGVVCFVQEPVLDPKTGMPVGADSISLYYLSRNGFPIRAEGRGLIYDDTPGEIIDAFLLNDRRSGRDKMFVIHSVSVRSSLVEPNSSGVFYSVDVFDLVGDALRRDDRASDWFGSGYGFVSNGEGVVYRFPYRTREDVRLAIGSPFATLMGGDRPIPVKLKFKSVIFDMPNIKGLTKKYLIRGDRAVVEEVGAGWCRIRYSGGARSTEMWLMCSVLDAESKEREGVDDR